MSGFTILLAGIPLLITPLNEEVQTYFTDYLSNESPLFSVSANRENLEFERNQNKRLYGADNPSISAFPDHYLESLALLRLITRQLLDYQVMLFHGAVVANNGKAYLFTAPSGTGKTTHMRLWLKQLPDAYVLNGDKPFLKVETDGAIKACGGPWRGKEELGCNEILPLEAICILERSSENHISPISPKDAIDTLVRQSSIPDGGEAMVKVFRLLDMISWNVRLFRLGCNMDPEAARVSIRAMVPERTEE